MSSKNDSSGFKKYLTPRNIGIVVVVCTVLVGIGLTVNRFVDKSKNGSSAVIGSASNIPVDGKWGAWGECKLDSDGVLRKYRKCVQNAQNGGKPCSQIDGGNEKMDCPAVNGGWRVDTTCVQKKDDIGNLFRDSTGREIWIKKKYCDNPIPRNGGKNCEGSAEVRCDPIDKNWIVQSDSYCALKKVENGREIWTKPNICKDTQYGGICEGSSETVCEPKNGEWLAPADSENACKPKVDKGGNILLDNTGREIWMKQKECSGARYGGICEGSSEERCVPVDGKWFVPPDSDQLCKIKEPEEIDSFGRKKFVKKKICMENKFGGICLGSSEAECTPVDGKWDPVPEDSDKVCTVKRDSAGNALIQDKREVWVKTRNCNPPKYGGLECQGSTEVYCKPIDGKRSVPEDSNEVCKIKYDDQKNPVKDANGQEIWEKQTPCVGAKFGGICTTGENITRCTPVPGQYFTPIDDDSVCIFDKTSNKWIKNKKCVGNKFGGICSGEPTDICNIIPGKWIESQPAMCGLENIAGKPILDPESPPRYFKTLKCQSGKYGGTCPPANEVYLVVPKNKSYDTTKEDAVAVCKAYGASVATRDQLQEAWRSGASWCSAGWLSDVPKAAYPNHTELNNSCGGFLPGVRDWTPENNKANVHCFGEKPIPNQTKNGDVIVPFNTRRYSIHSKDIMNTRCDPPQPYRRLLIRNSEGCDNEPATVKNNPELVVRLAVLIYGKWSTSCSPGPNPPNSTIVCRIRDADGKKDYSIDQKSTHPDVNFNPFSLLFMKKQWIFITASGIPSSNPLLGPFRMQIVREQGMISTSLKDGFLAFSPIINQVNKGYLTRENLSADDRMTLFIYNSDTNQFIHLWTGFSLDQRNVQTNGVKIELRFSDPDDPRQKFTYNKSTLLITSVLNPSFSVDDEGGSSEFGKPLEMWSTNPNNNNQKILMVPIKGAINF